MALEDIQKKIVSDAEHKKAQILEVAQQQVEEILKQAKKSAHEYSEDQQKYALGLAENLERGLVIDARRKLANEILAQKRTRLEQTFIKAKEEFIASSEYTKIMKNLVIKSIVSKNEEVLIGSDEKHLNQGWLDDINKTSGSSLKFASHKGEFQGGVILMDGETFVNITIDTLMGLLRESTEKPVADILFRG